MPSTTNVPPAGAARLLLTALLGALLIAGCPDIVFTLEPKTGLSDKEAVAVDEALHQFLALTPVLASWGDVYPGLRALLAGDPLDETACPANEVTQLAEGVSTIAVNYDALSCAGAALVGETPTTGRITYTIDEQSVSGDIQHDGLVIDGRAVSGSASLGFALAADGRLELGGALRVSTADSDATGVVNLSYPGNGEFTITNGVWQTPNLDFDIEIVAPTDPESVATTVSPAGNPRFIPRTGEIAFWYAPLVRIQIQFEPDSPETGEVAIVWNETQTFRRTIPR